MLKIFIKKYYLLKNRENLFFFLFEEKNILISFKKSHLIQEGKHKQGGDTSEYIAKRWFSC
jgi:hypothetical protein